jgi:hypothetical protein
MKRLSLLFCLLFVINSSSFAQRRNYKQDEISVSVGVITLHQMYDLTERGISSAATAGLYWLGSAKYSASINANYFHYINKTVALGVIYCYQTSKILDSSIYTHKFDHNYHDKYYSIVPTVKVNLVTKKTWRIYCKGGIGATFDHRTCTDDNTHSNLVRITTQCSCGFEYGKTICAFTELGIGAEGLAEAGLRMRFR